MTPSPSHAAKNSWDSRDSMQQNQPAWNMSKTIQPCGLRSVAKLLNPRSYPAARGIDKQSGQMVENIPWRTILRWQVEERELFASSDFHRPVKGQAARHNHFTFSLVRHSAHLLVTHGTLVTGTNRAPKSPLERVATYFPMAGETPCKARSPVALISHTFRARRGSYFAWRC